MRALVLVMLLAGVAAAEPRTVPFGFDHNVHERDVNVSGGEDIPCARCHVLAKGMLVGKPEHSACFGACHGAAPVAPKRGDKLAPGDREKICLACHSEAQLAAPYTGKLPVPYPPYTVDADFGITLGHKQHAQIACTLCHAPESTKKWVPHARCATCHDTKAKTPMTSCSACHPRAVGKPQPPELAAVHDTVTSVFSHKAHDKHGAKDCTLCHARVATTDDTELPRPTANDCARCHDGKQAFSTLVACRKCHDKEPEGGFKVARPEKRFRHDQHNALVGACSACHPLSPQGEVMVASHTACTACHADDFGARWPTLCGACHNATEPWRPLTADRPLPEKTEFGATLDHSKHPGDCKACHSLKTQAVQLRPPRGHASCITCHHASGGPAPQMTECAACHKAGRAAARDEQRAADPWSVRRAFDHGAHPGACNTCHVDLAGADVVTLPVPPKPTCASCHDGTVAFKLTGTTCSRCHQGKQP